MPERKEQRERRKKIARTNFEETEDLGAVDLLKSIVPTYYDAKQRMSELKGITDADNATIKNLMKDIGSNSCKVDDYKVTVSIQDRESFNEAKLLDYVRSHGALKSCIKTKEYVDIDALENAIYNGLVSKETLAELNNCKEHKFIETLRVTKSKKKKEE